MLGIKSHRPPIEGDIADEIRDAVVRVAKGQLNEEEKAVQERLKKALEKYKMRFDCMSYLEDELDWIKNIVWGDEIGF